MRIALFNIFILNRNSICKIYMFKQMQLTEKPKQITQRTYTKVISEKPNLKKDKSKGGKTSTPANVECNSTFLIEPQAKVIDKGSSSPEGRPIKVCLFMLCI
jgi:hypothetical protein